MKNSQSQSNQERKQKASYIVHSKVKPVVVKHVLKDQIAPLADPRTAHLQSYQGKESVRFSEMSMSPRFYGQGHPPYFGKPEEVSKDLITNLEKGMTDLRFSTKKENLDPHYGQPFRQGPYTMASGFRQDDEIRSVRSGFDQVPAQMWHSNQEVNMTIDELDRLKQANEDRIKQIESKYFQRKDELRNVREIFQEKAELREPKEKHVDSSLSYPTYGRGIDPNPGFDTYMINKGLCHDSGSPKKKKKEGEDDGDSHRKKGKRPKIISPRRQKYETQFERYFVGKHVEQPLQEKPQELEKSKSLGKFDTITKLEGSLNVKVIEKQKQEQEKLRQKKLAKQAQRGKSLVHLENEVEKYLIQEALVLLSQEFIDRLRVVYESCKDQPDSDQEKISLNQLVATIVEDEFFEDKMELIVRESIDWEKEMFEDLLNRVLTDFKDPNISWLQFLGFFSKRGRLQGYNEIQVSPTKGGPRLSQSVAPNAEQGQSEKDQKREKLQKNVRDKLHYKQDMVPKEGKGKYNITVPVPYEFLNKTKTQKTIREQKLEEMLKEKEQEILEVRQYQFKANRIPRTTTEPLYQRIMESNEARRQEVKRLSMAITKEREKPFSFYERDKNKPKVSYDELPEAMRQPAFRANVVPWKILVPLYKRMMDDAEMKREKRIKAFAEQSLAMSRLPPRMAEHEKMKRLLSQENQYKSRSDSLDKYCTFQPPRAKPVPDFKRLQKQFQHSLEAQRKSQKITVPDPFTFHQPKSTAKMRQYLDAENQKINPTLKQKLRIARTCSPGERDVKENPAMTRKFDAYVQQRRSQMEEKKNTEEVKFQEEIGRFIKQNRLAQRVRCSPAIVNNAIELKRRKTLSLLKARDTMHKFEKNWNDQKELIKYNVANKPLLVEQVSKAFMRNLSQIRELQRYVNILREANLNPDEHLTEEQKELLLSAEYFDRLNAATAYFPDNMMPQHQLQAQEMDLNGEEGDEEDDDEEEGGYDQNQQDGIGSEPIEENQQEEDEDEDNEEDGGQNQNQNEGTYEDNNQNQDNEGEYEGMEGEDEGEDQEEGEEGDEDDMVEIDEEQLKAYLMYQQQQMAQNMGGDMDEEDEEGMDDEDMEEEEEDQ